MIVLIRGGGDLGSGVALRLHRSGLRVLITELPEPLAVRRLVSFAEAVYNGETVVEEITARRVNDPSDMLRVLQIFSRGQIPVLVDPECQAALGVHPTVIVDARMLKRSPEPLRHNAQLFIGLGPGFSAGKDCHAVIETRRGHTLGRVIWQGEAEQDTGIPEGIHDGLIERVLRSPAEGILAPFVKIGEHVEPGQMIAEVAGVSVKAPFAGVLRGILREGASVTQGLKIGDLDPRNDARVRQLVSDKALAIGGGVLEAILSRSNLRANLWK